MSTTPAQLAANAINARSSAGPRTPEGLSASSKNATSNGLYATHDFIRPGEEHLYEELNASLFNDLARLAYSNATAELRKLQTERIFRNESFSEGTDLSNFGICDWASIEARLSRTTAAAYRLRKVEAKAEPDAFYNAPQPPERQYSSFCKNTESPAPAMPRAA